MTYDRPNELEGITIKYELACAAVYVTYNFQDGKLTEIFTRIGKAGSCSGCLVQSLSRVLSISIQEGIDVKKLAKTLIGMECVGSQMGARDDPNRLTSCMDAVARELYRFERDAKGAKKVKCKVCDNTIPIKGGTSIMLLTQDGAVTMPIEDGQVDGCANCIGKEQGETQTGE